MNELLAKVKSALGIVGDYQDETLTEYITEVKAFLIDAGVQEKNITVGIVARGVSDLWNYGSGGVGFSQYFLQRAVQLSYQSSNYSSSGQMARINEVTLLASAWIGSENLFSQVVSLNGVTKNSQIDLTPSVEQLAIFHEKDLTFVTENEGGVVTVYAIGQKPQNDYTIQVTITEVAYG